MNPMEELWDKVAQPEKDGQKYISYKNDQDLLFLYANGFVDFRKFSLDDWIRSFQPSKQKDGSYRVTHEQWLEKEKFRFAGAVGEPFDPERLKEREYSEAEFTAVLKHFICPSTWIAETNIPQILDFYRSKNKLVNGKILMDRILKKELEEVLEKVPSPLRILQLDVARVRGRGKLKIEAAPKSGYVAGQNAQKLAAERLRQLAQTPEKPAEPIPGIETVPLKELRKKKRPTPGRV